MKNPELDGLVLNIEFTLISIIQGVALYFLVENARTPLMSLSFATWPYIATGLLIILIFWSRSVLHTLTVIRWPLEFGHNFIYVASTLLEAMAFTQLNEPAHWYALLALYAALVWALFVFDLRIIRKRQAESRTKSGRELFRILEEDQFSNIRFLVPSNIAFNAAAWFLVTYWPEIFIARGWHLALASFQLASSLFYLSYGIRFYRRVLPLITATREGGAAA